MTICECMCADFLRLDTDDLYECNFAMVDPPMNISATDIQVQGRSDITLDFGEWDHIDNYHKFVVNWMTHLNKFLAKDAVVFVWWMKWDSLSTHISIMEQLGFQLMTIHTWHKTNPAPKFRKTTPVSSCEWLLHFVRGDTPMTWLGQNEMHNFIQSPICMGRERIRHPKTNETIAKTQKPIKVLDKFIRMYEDFIDVILDPFAGVCSTGIAALHNDKDCIMVEKDSTIHAYGAQRLDEEIQKT